MCVIVVHCSTSKVSFLNVVKAKLPFTMKENELNVEGCRDGKKSVVYICSKT